MKLRSAHLKNVKGIGELILNFVDPVKNKVRDRTVIVGKNGSGKTTILETIYTIVSLLETKEKGIPKADPSIFSPAVIELILEIPGVFMQIERVRVISGRFTELEGPVSTSDILLDYVETIAGEKYPVFHYHPPGEDTTSLITDAISGIDEDPFIGNLLFFPTDRLTQFDIEGDMTNENPKFRWTFRYNRNHKEWEGSLESYLVWLYFRDLKVQKKKPDTPSRFKEFTTFVNRFLERKEITDVNDDYRVEVTDKATQKTMTLDALSSGEKQIVLFIGEIMRNIRQGSILLIDEPELHLHPVWQKIFMETLTVICKKYDAQLIVTTQSPRIAESVIGYEVVNLDNLLEESRP